MAVAGSSRRRQLTPLLGLSLLRREGPWLAVPPHRCSLAPLAPPGWLASCPSFLALSWPLFPVWGVVPPSPDVQVGIEGPARSVHEAVTATATVLMFGSSLVISEGGRRAAMSSLNQANRANRRTYVRHPAMIGGHSLPWGTSWREGEARDGNKRPDEGTSWPHFDVLVRCGSP